MFGHFLRQHWIILRFADSENVFQNLFQFTGLFLYLRPYHNPWIKKAKKLLGCAQDFRLENWILVEWIDKTQTLPKLSLENLGRVCVLPIHSTTFQFSNLKSWAHPYNFFAFLIHGLWFGRSYKNRPVLYTIE